MSWYKQSRALPAIENKYYEPGTEPRGLEYLNNLLTPEHAKKLSEPKMQYLNSGWYGSAFTFDNTNIVRKYTSDSEEVKIAKKILSKQKNHKPLPGIVYVYSVRDLSRDIYRNKTNKNPNNMMELGEYFLSEITMEKVIPLSEKQKKIFEYNFWNIKIKVKNKTDDYIIDYIRKERELEKTYGEDKKYTDEDYEFINIIINFARTVLSANYSDRDIHPGNVGLRKGRELVVLDLGSVDIV